MKYLLNPLALLCGLVKVILLSATAGRAEFKELLKHIRFLISLRVFSEIINISFKIILKYDCLMLSDCKVYRRFPLHGTCPYSELFWSVFSRILIEYCVSLRIQSECGKLPTTITVNTNTFQAVFYICLFFGIQRVNWPSLRSIFICQMQSKVYF